tara:strand:+ start:11773 stop:12609 length:837 start_codon:yes stop_codon:yes gene_type:complete
MDEEITTGIEKMNLEGKDASEDITEGVGKMSIKSPKTAGVTSKFQKLSINKPSKKVLSSGIRKKRNKAFKRGFMDKFRKRIQDMKQKREFKSSSYNPKNDDIEKEADKAVIKWNDSGDEYTDSDDDMSFGKKQKKDIKGMIKKILLYGGLPTLLVVSLGVLSTKKFSKKNLKQNTKVKVSGKLKKNTKVKVSKEEKLFKKDFVKKLKEMILKRKKELDSLEKDARNNEIELQTRQTRRKKSSSNPFEETPEYRKHILKQNILKQNKKRGGGFGRTRNK